MKEDTDKKYTVDNIQALSAAEHVKMRPNLYFEACFKEKALDLLPFEVLCHAFDETVDGKCNRIKLTIWNHAFSVEYNAGMSLSTRADDLTSAEMIMTQIRACSNLKKHLEVGQEFCRLGMATINFAASYCKLTTISNAKKGVFEFNSGVTSAKVITTVNAAENQTSIYMEPDRELFEGLGFTSAGITQKAAAIRQRLPQLDLSIDDKIETNK